MLANSAIERLRYHRLENKPFKYDLRRYNATYAVYIKGSINVFGKPPLTAIYTLKNYFLGSNSKNYTFTRTYPLIIKFYNPNCAMCEIRYNIFLPIATNDRKDVAPNKGDHIVLSGNPSFDVYARTFYGKPKSEDYITQAVRLHRILNKYNITDNMINPTTYYIAEYNHGARYKPRRNEVWFLKA